MSGARSVAGGARAADLLVQLAARGVRSLHWTGLADGDRPRADRARSNPVDRRRRTVAMGKQLLQLLRAANRGDRRTLRGGSGGAMAGSPHRAPRTVPARHRRGAGARVLPQSLWAAPLVRDEVRGHRRQPAAPLPRDRVGVHARENRGVHVAAALPRMRGRAAAGRVARRPRGRRADRGFLRAVSAASAPVARRDRAFGDRPPRRAADPARDLRAPAVPGERRHRLSVDGPRGGHALGRGGAADPAGNPDRVLAGRGALHPR